MSHVCALYSFVGILFTLWVYIMVSKQPFFIAGLEDPDKAKDSAFGAMIMFCLTLAYSIYTIFTTNPDNEKEELGEGSGMEGYQLNTGVADYGARLD